MPRRSKNAPDIIGAREKDLEALRLRREGLRYEAIGEKMGCSRQAAHKSVSRALKKLIEETTEAAEEVRTLELQRLDAMIEALWPKVLRGGETACDRVLKIMERRARYLGLDQQVERQSHTIEEGPSVTVYLPDNGRRTITVPADE